MSETVTAHIEITIYKVNCNACGAEGSFEASVDSDGDITITVDRCECADQKIEQEAFEEGKRDERESHFCEGLS